MLLVIRDALKSRPMGRIDRRNSSLEMWTSFAPSRRLVVRWRIRVPIACNSPLSSGAMSWSGTTYRKGQVPSDQEDRILELESIVHIVVVDDDRGAENDPDRDDSTRG